MSRKSSQRRNSLRFRPERSTLGWIDAESASAEFAPTIPALVFDESFKGCSVVVLDVPAVHLGDRIRIKVGDLPVMRAEVRWRREIDEGVLKVGIMFND